MSDRGVIVYGHIGPKLHMEALATAILHSCHLTIVPPHIMPTYDLKEVALFHATPPTEIDWHSDKSELTKTRRERTHPNEPFYRKFQKGRKW